MPRRPPAAAPAWLGVAWKGMAVVTVGVLCMGVGWFIFRGPGARALAPPPTTEKQVVAKASPKPPTPRPAGGVAAAEKAPPRPSAPPPKPVVQPAITFEKDVLPILQNKCVSCHGELKKSGKLDVRTIAALKKGGAGGPSLAPGMPENSPLWDEVTNDRMPPGGKNRLTAGEKKTLRDWILSGAK